MSNDLLGIFAALLDHSLRIEIGRTYEYNEIEKAHEALENHKSVGKPLLRLAGTE